MSGLREQQLADPTPGAYLRMRAALDLMHATRRQHGPGMVPLVTALESAGLLQSPETAAELAQLRARVAELEAERHSTNEVLSETAEAIRAKDQRIVELEERPLAWAEQLDAKSLDNLLITLGQATDYEPMQGAISEIHEVLAGFRAAAVEAGDLR